MRDVASNARNTHECEYRYHKESIVSTTGARKAKRLFKISTFCTFAVIILSHGSLSEVVNVDGNNGG